MQALTSPSPLWLKYRTTINPFRKQILNEASLHSSPLQSLLPAPRIYSRPALNLAPLRKATVKILWGF